MSDGWRTEIVTDAGALAALEPEWWDLWRRSPGATPFASPAWGLPWWECFGAGGLRTALVRRDGRLVAMAPAFVENGECGLRLLPIGVGISDHLDVLLDAELGEEASGRLVAALVEAGGWDSWDLEDLRPGAAAWRLPVPAAHAEVSCFVCPCPVIAPLDEALSAVPSRQRRKLRMARHRAARRDTRIAVVPPDAVAGFLPVLSALHATRWALDGGLGVLVDPVVQRFHAAALPRLAAAGLVRAATVTIDGQVAGAYYGLQDRTGAYAYIGGYDPAFAFESPGTLLLGAAMEAAARAGATSFSLLRGAEPYKYAWGAVDRPNHRRSFRRI